MDEVTTPERYRQAWRFAAEAHQGQRYPGTELPYLLHLGYVVLEVAAALQVETVEQPVLAMQCALLHDVLEDTAVSYPQLQARFGTAVAEGVLALTKDARLAKEAQMADSLARIRRQPPEIALVKLADRISNLDPPPPYWDSTRIAHYRQEAQQILAALGEASPLLAERLRRKMAAYAVPAAESHPPAAGIS